MNGSILVRLNYGKVLSGRVHAPISIEEVFFLICFFVFIFIPFLSCFV